MRARASIFTTVGLILVMVATALYLLNRRIHPRIGPQHTYTLSQSPRFLTEELAMARARETLGRDGYDVALWQPLRDGHTSAPDGRTDEFMARNPATANRGVIMFTSTTDSPRLVSVTLNGSRVVFQTSIAK